MYPNRVISTAVLFLLLGTTIPAFAQKGQEKKGGGGGKGQQAQHQQQPQHAQKQVQPQRAQRVRRQQQPQRAQSVASNHGNGNNGNHYGRIPDDRYRAHFGRDHRFRMGHPRFVSGYNRFQYSGYWFGYNEPWPSGWYYTDDIYVMYVGGGYYLYNPRHPGIRITLNLF
jgi:hypothetical protein